MQCRTVAIPGCDLVKVIAADSHEAVALTNAGLEELIGPAVRTAGVDPTATTRLLVPTTVRVEVSVPASIHDAECAAVGVDSFYVYARVGLQSVRVAAPQRTSGIQTC